MRFLLDDYFLAYTDGKKELAFPLSNPLPISEILAMANIPVWDHYQLSLNGQPVTDLTTQVSDGDEMKISPEKL
jgi:hypothetical protein